jgi:A/G-specific adenine glycosylase
MAMQENTTPWLPERLSERLLAWFDQHARPLPWRRDRTPYRVWVAEVMLQQTQAETVIPYYARFLARFPTLETLAAAELEDVLKVWEGLGYYARARNLHAAARQVMAELGGRLPGTFEGLRALPGFGPYTAGAVASIAFGQPVVALDGNARRVLTRLFAVEGDLRRAPATPRLMALGQALLPPDRPGAFNEALMELGATLCRPRAPHCADCPLSGDCLAHRAGRETLFPQTTPRRPQPHYDVTAAVLTRLDGCVLLTRRAANDFLGGLWEFPGGKREAGESLPQCLAREMREEVGVEVEVGEPFLRLKHAYTHFRITLYVFRCRLLNGEPRCLDCAGVRWVAPAEMDALPMSATDRRIARAVQAEYQEGRWKSQQREAKSGLPASLP